MNKLDARIDDALNKRAENQLYRALTTNDSLIDFSSNDFLGFSKSAFIKQRVEEDLQQLKYHKWGATGSRLLNGNSIVYEEVEEMLAEFYHTEAALVFNTGFAANVGLISTVVSKEDIIYYDELVHASIHQGMRLSGARLVSFCHNDMEDLKAQLALIKQGQIGFIFTESLFSMQGDRAPLVDLAEIATQNGLHLIVDEAHANGIFGSLGSGLCNEAGVEDKCFARVFTFGKAIGTHGGVVVGSKILKEYLINFSKSFIYTTALNLPTLQSVKHAYFLLQNNTNQRIRLVNLMNYFNNSIAVKKLQDKVIGNGPIYGFLVGGNENCKKAAIYLQDHGFDVRPILAPTVQKGKERLRIILHSFNKELEIDRLISKIIEIQ